MIFDLPGNISQVPVAGRAGETDSILSFKNTHRGFTELSWSAMIWTQRGFWANPTTAASKIPPLPMCSEPAHGVRAPAPSTHGFRRWAIGPLRQLVPKPSTKPPVGRKSGKAAAWPLLQDIGVFFSGFPAGPLLSESPILFRSRARKQADFSFSLHRIILQGVGMKVGKEMCYISQGWEESS